MSYSTLVAGTITLSKYADKEIDWYLEKLEKKKVIFSKGSFIYLICDIKKGKDYIFGKLMKIRKSMKEQYFDTIKWKPIEKTLKVRRVEIYSRFIIFNSETIVFEDRKNYLPRTQFKSTLEELIYNIVEALVQINITYRRDEEKIEEFIKKSDRIISLEFRNMKTSNPIKLKGVEATEKLISDGKVKNLKVKNEEGLNVEQEILAGGLELSKHGVIEEAKIIREKGERVDSFSTKTKLLKRKVFIDDDSVFIETTKEFK